MRCSNADKLYINRHAERSRTKRQLLLIILFDNRPDICTRLHSNLLLALLNISQKFKHCLTIKAASNEITAHLDAIPDILKQPIETRLILK